MASPQEPPGRVRAWPATLTAIALVAAAGLLVGGVTSFAQQVLPPWAAPLANSSGSWTLVTFALVWWSRAGLVVSAVLGVVSFVLLVQGYAAVSTWRGFPYSGNLFTVVAVVAGPVIGSAASLARDRAGALGAMAGAVPSAVLIGEGCYGLTVVANTTSAVYWWAQLAVGVVLTIGLAARGKYGRRERLWALAGVVAGSAAFYVLYAFVL